MGQTFRQPETFNALTKQKIVCINALADHDLIYSHMFFFLFKCTRTPNAIS